MTTAGRGLPVAPLGAAAPTRYMGGSATTTGVAQWGPPQVGDFLVNDVVIDSGGRWWICTSAGSPGSWQVIAPVMSSKTTVTVNQATYNTLLPSVTYPGSLGSLQLGTIIANEAVPFAMWEMGMFGHGAWGSTQTDLNFELTLGGTVLGSIVSVPSSTFSTSDTLRWDARCTLICLTNGSSGTWKGHFVVTLTDSTLSPSTANYSACGGTGNSPFTVDSTSNEALALEAEWGNATYGASLTTDVSWFRRMV